MQHPNKYEKMENFDEIQKLINQILNEQNIRGIPVFEGYSPNEMQYILYSTFGKNSPIQLLKLSESNYNRIPIINQIKYLLRLIDKLGELKLTDKGFLPTKVVAEISKLYKETDAMSINLTRILSELSGVVKKRKNKLSLTKKGKMELSDNHALLKSIITAFTIKFNWAYYDWYGENQIGQLGYGFSLILSSKYGSKKKPDTFYAKKYLSAFQQLLESMEPDSFESKETIASKCYSLRTFDRFLDYFGLIKIDSQYIWDSEKFIVKTKLFYELIKVKPHIITRNKLGDKWLN